MKSFYFLFICFFLSFFQILLGQTGIHGVIKDQEGLALPGAHIHLLGTNHYTVSDFDGSYSLTGVDLGEYKLRVSYIGFSDYEQKVVIESAGLQHIDVSLAEGVELTEIVVNARLEGQNKAFNTQKNNINITNVVAQEQIERFPDANIGDALKRIPGVNVQYDQGEARFANIRGTAPELNSVTINGERIPSAEAEERFVQMDLIPADMIETIELNKAVTPNMDGDAIGGSINLVTLKAGEGERIKGTIGGGYSVLAEEFLPKGKLAYSNRFANGKFGVLLDASIFNRHTRSDNVEADWDYTDESDPNGTAFTEEIQIRQYYVQRLRQSYAANLDYRFNRQNNLYFTAMFNRRKDWETRYRYIFTDIESTDDGGYVAELRRETKGGVDDTKNRRLENQHTYMFGLGGEHLFNQVKLNWYLSTDQAGEERPNERYIAFRSKDQPIQLDLSDSREPMARPLSVDAQDLGAGAYEFRELTEEFQDTKEENTTGRFDVMIPYDLSNTISGNFQFGAKYKHKTKYRTNDFYEYSPLDEDAFLEESLDNIIDETQDNFLAGDYEIGSQADPEYIGDIDLQNGFEEEQDLEELAGNFDAEENVFGAFFMYTANLSQKTTVLAGLRYENTSVEYEGEILDVDEEVLTRTPREADSYGNLMPGLHIKYSPNQWANLRFAWTNTLARPNYFDLVPYQEIIREDNEISIGNPGLEATTSMNFDILSELYFKNIGVISAGAFYKNLSNVIATKTSNDVTFQGVLYDQLEQPVNAGDADLYGFELGLVRRLDFLPGVLGNLSLYANYTFTDSELKNITLEDREDEELPLVGTPKNLVNLSLAYDVRKLDVRLSYNYADAFIEEYDDEEFYDRWYDAVSYLDFIANYQVTDTWRIYASVNNILDTPLRYYQGAENRTAQAEYYGLQLRFGLKFDFR